ncbi:MAG TPA: acyl-CoA carboxylase subunit beta [Caldisericia bacterium]|nr:acyl-CoA carboxylase subunit beta [Caldisericia bacterium]HPF48294.1 acyl-CoA carboxylase subunit beta [Caldisericia bacterium]HPI83527.1 acyl-CoA carboxylase subunit beta [Caldisericia bacterium]HPQ92747.1 acyl-CoA carboxylase subunit beta [Caldisericia bacterium]HRV74155.1 acyl-CoA carboxylase subunit beta [Caldisericia bacterium]
MAKDINDLIAEKNRRLESARNDTPEAKAKQEKRGKKTARDRITMLLDTDSFAETDVLVSHRKDYPESENYVPAEAVVTGYGTIEGRLVFIFSQDFASMGGSLSEMHGRKIAKIMDMAARAGAPVIGINDSGGARIQEGVDALSGYGQVFYRNTIYSGVIPQISLVLGPSAGGAVYSPALTDFIFMVDGISNMFITGPNVIKSVTGEIVDKESLGGSKVHSSKSGVCHKRFPTEEECMESVRHLIRFLPQNYSELPPRIVGGDDPNRASMALREIVPIDPNKPYDVRNVIREISDEGEFFEIQPEFARNLVIGFMRVDGYPVGVVANQPNYLAGCLDINCSDKGSRFIRTCDAYNIPLLNIVDVPGFLPGVAQEHNGIIRHGAKLLYAFAEATTPKITVILRKAYGGAYLAMCSRDMGADHVFAWPQAHIAVMGAEGAVKLLYSDEIKKAENMDEFIAKKAAEYNENYGNPYIAAERGYVDAVINPEETRPRIAYALHMLKNKSEHRPKRKHGNIPV